MAILLLANVIVLVAGVTARGERDPEAEILRRPAGKDSIRILPAAPTASAASAPRANSASNGAQSCLEWGNFARQESSAVRAVLDTLNLGERLSTRQVSLSSGFWVYLPPPATQGDQPKRLARLRRLGIEGYSELKVEGKLRGAISLGLFRNQDGAAEHLASIKRKGLEGALLEPHELPGEQTVFRIRAPEPAVVTQLGELKATHPGTDLKTVSCP